MTRDLRQTGSPRIIPGYLRYELAPAWQTEPVTQLVKRGRLRSEVMAEMSEPTPPFELAPGQPQALKKWGHSEEWELYCWRPVINPQARAPDGAGVSTFSSRLIAIEQARARRRGPTGFLTRLRDMRPGFKRQGKTR